MFLKKVCTPAKVYFVFSLIGFVGTALQNLYNRDKYCLGTMQCSVPSCFGVFVVKAVSILFWTYVLNLICRDGHPTLSWVLVLLPFLIIVSLVAALEYSQKKQKRNQP